LTTPQPSGPTPRPTTARPSPKRSPTPPRQCSPATSRLIPSRRSAAPCERGRSATGSAAQSSHPKDLAAIVRWLHTAPLPLAAPPGPARGGPQPPGTRRGPLPRAAQPDQPQAGRNRRRSEHGQPETGRAEQLDAVRRGDRRSARQPAQGRQVDPTAHAQDGDPRTVVNSTQAGRLLAAVGQQGERAERMVAFFGCMYYAALRPEEAVELRPENFASLPDHGWGELILTNSEPRSGTWWTDSGSARQRRELKHRPRGETRPVPLHPELVALFSEHLKRYPPGPD